MVDEVTVIDNPIESRYEAHADGRRAGLLDYRRRPGRISLIHTEVDEHFGGRRIGTRLVVTALDEARDDRLAVLPICPLVAAYIDRHPEYQDLVPKGFRRPTPSFEGGDSGGGRPPDSA